METSWFFRLQFCWAYDSTYDSNFRFSLGRKLFYDSDYNSDSITTENQPQEHKSIAQRNTSWLLLVLLEFSVKFPNAYIMYVWFNNVTWIEPLS